MELELNRAMELLQQKDAQVQAMQRHADGLASMQQHTLEETRAEREALQRKLAGRDEHIRRMGERDGRYGSTMLRRGMGADVEVDGLGVNENILELEVRQNGVRTRGGVTGHEEGEDSRCCG